MPVDAAILRRLAALRLSAHAMAEVLGIIAEIQEREESRRRRDRDRKRGKSAEAPRNFHGNSAGNSGKSSPDKERSPLHPPKETNPSSPSLRSVDIPARAKPADPDPKPEPKPEPKPSPRQELERVLDGEHAAAVIDHRQRIRKALTPHAARLLAGKFARCDDPNAAADAMIANGWQGFEPEWLDGRPVRANGRSPPQGRHEPRGSARFATLLRQMDDRQRDPDGQAARPADRDHAGPTLDLRPAGRDDDGPPG